MRFRRVVGDATWGEAVGGRRMCVVGRGKSNVAVTTDDFKVTNSTLGIEHNAPLSYDMGL